MESLYSACAPNHGAMNPGIPVISGSGTNLSQAVNTAFNACYAEWHQEVTGGMHSQIIFDTLVPVARGSFDVSSMICEILIDRFDSSALRGVGLMQCPSVL